MSKITCMRNQPAHNFGFLSDLSNRLLTPLPWISCIPHSSIIYVSLVTWCSVNIMEINNRMKQFYTEIYREITQRFPQSTYSTLIHSLTQHKFIKSLPSLFICVDYAHNTPPKKKKKSNSTLPFDFALWGAVFQWDGERGSQQESWSYKQESQNL